MPTAMYMAIATVGAALLIIALERRFPYDRGIQLWRRGMALDLFAYGIVQSVCLGFLIQLLITKVDQATGASRQGLVTHWSTAAQLLFFVVTHDFYIYVFHRCQHRFALLWRLHQAHHSSSIVDWIAGARSHVLEILINQTIEFGVMMWLGAPPLVIALKGAISGIWGMWIHSNINVKTGVLQFVINGPEAHRWHHASEFPDDGANYGTKFAFWDHLFGTVYRPAGKPNAYGLTAPFPATWWGQFAAAFRKPHKELQ